MKALFQYNFQKCMGRKGLKNSFIKGIPILVVFEDSLF